MTRESLGTGDAMKRIATEAENPTFDLMYGGSLANYVANKDLFQDYLSPEDKSLMPEYQNKLGYCTNYTVENMPRRFPKGDRKALWSRPQARNPSLVIAIKTFALYQKILDGRFV